MSNIGDTLGALYLGATIALVMFGITIFQTYFYYMNYGQDSRSIKLLVMFVFLLDAAQSVILCYMNYYYLVSVGINQVVGSSFDKLAHTISISSITTVLASVIAQAFYVTRIYQLCQPRWRWWICCPITISIVAHFAVGIAEYSIFYINAETLTRKNTRDIVIPYMISNLLPDVMITVGLCVLLCNRRAEVQVSRMHRIIQNIIIFCVERFILSMALSILEIVTYTVLRHTLYPSAIDMVYGKVVINSLLATLNCRHAVKRGGGHGNQSTEDDTTTSVPRNTPIRTVLTRMYVTGNTAKSSINHANRYALHTRDLECSIQCNKS